MFHSFLYVYQRVDMDNHCIWHVVDATVLQFQLKIMHDIPTNMRTKALCMVHTTHHQQSPTCWWPPESTLTTESSSTIIPCIGMALFNNIWIDPPTFYRVKFQLFEDIESRCLLIFSFIIKSWSLHASGCWAKAPDFPSAVHQAWPKYSRRHLRLQVRWLSEWSPTKHRARPRICLIVKQDQPMEKETRNEIGFLQCPPLQQSGSKWPNTFKIKVWGVQLLGIHGS